MSKFDSVDADDSEPTDDDKPAVKGRMYFQTADYFQVRAQTLKEAVFSILNHPAGHEIGVRLKRPGRLVNKKREIGSALGRAYKSGIGQQYTHFSFPLAFSQSRLQDSQLRHFAIHQR